MTDLIDKVNAYGAKKAEVEEAELSQAQKRYDHLKQLLDVMRDDVLDAIDLANACKQAGIPMKSRLSWNNVAWGKPVSDGYTVADGVTHNVGFVAPPGGGDFEGIGAIGDPSGVLCVEPQYLRIYNDGGSVWSKTKVPMDAKIRIMERMVVKIPAFIQEFRQYVESVVEE